MCKILASLLLILLVGNIAFAQVNDGHIRKQVLKSNKIGKVYTFGRLTKDGGTETHLQYLGKTTTKDGRSFKFLNSIWYWGLSHRAQLRILIFNAGNQYIGNYYISTVYDIPVKLQDQKLVFVNTDPNCDKKLRIYLRLKNGLPRQFFRKCKGNYGDIYSFGTN